MAKNILMLGPGDPGRLTSGLGVAAFHISHFLNNYANLFLINLDGTEWVENIQKDTRTSTIEIDLKEFTDFKVTSEITKVSVESFITPYWTEEKTVTIDEKNQLAYEYEQVTKKIVKESEKVIYDVIYAHDWLTFKTGIALKERENKPLVLHIHSLEYDRNCGNNQSWVFELEREACQKADAIICVSKYSKRILDTVYGIDPNKIHVVYNGFENRDYLPKQNPFKEKVILFVGRLTGQKGPTKFLEIAELVHEQNPNTRFIMAGEGDLYKSMIEAGAHSTVADKFHMTGFLHEPDLMKAFAMADIYCMPSVSEPFGLTALEAAGAGIPLVLSKNSGASEIMKGALLANFDDTPAFADLLTQLLDDEELAINLAKSNLKILKDLSWKKAGSHILEIISEY